MKDFIKIFIICVEMHVLVSCKKYEPCKGIASKIVYDLRSEDLGNIPYSGYDSLYFEVSDSSAVIDTLLFVGEGKQNYEYWIEDRPNGGCPASYFGKAFKINFKSTGLVNILFSFQSTEYNADVLVTYNNQTYTTSVFTLKGEPFGFYSNYMVLNGRSYYKISAGCENSYTTHQCDTSFMLINQNQGILRLVPNTKSNLTFLK